MNWYLKVMKQYADFSGRARRKEYWMFILIYFIILLVAALLDNVLGLTFNLFGVDLLYGWLYTLVGFVHLIPGLAAAVRRLHDVGKSGWWYFIGFIPLIGAIVLLVWMCTDSQPAENQWGENPKEVI